jgi:hypothetical protein
VKKALIYLFAAIITASMVMDLGSIRRNLALQGFETADLFSAQPMHAPKGALPLSHSQNAGHMAHQARPHLPRLDFQAKAHLVPSPDSENAQRPSDALAFLPQNPIKDIFHPPA